MHELQKHSQMNMISSSLPKIDSKKKEADGDVNLEELLNDISRDILKVYKATFNPQADVHMRNPLDLLTVTNLTLLKLLLSILGDRISARILHEGDQPYRVPGPLGSCKRRKDS